VRESGYVVEVCRDQENTTEKKLNHANRIKAMIIAAGRP
jgi:hypothetical protein